MTTPPIKTETESASDLGAALAKHQIVDEIPYVTVPAGYELRDLESLMRTPVRIRGKATFNSEESYVEYINRFAVDSTLIFASKGNCTLEAILDYHEPALPSWCTHRAVLTLAHSPEWKTWTGKNGVAMNQVAFAEFLEDNVADIAEPSGATVLEAASALEAKKTVQFKSGVNLSNGAVQFTYNEDLSSGKGNGILTLPTRFTLGLSPFENGSPYRVQCRLRYRIHDDKLTFTYLIERPHKVLEAAFHDVLLAVEKATETRPLLGSFRND